jgi:hypothetical protein
MTWDLGSFATTVFGAGFGAAVMQAFLSLYRDYRQRKAPAAYMAMRLAVILEAYASACSVLISDNHDANAEQGPDDQYPNWTLTLPELPPYPDDADGWRAIDRVLAGRCLNFRNKIIGSQGIIRSTENYAVDDLARTIDEELACRGLEAWEIGVALRCKHSIEGADTVWPYAEALKTSLEGTKQAQKAQVDRNKGMRDFFLSMHARPKPPSHIP